MGRRDKFARKVNKLDNVACQSKDGQRVHPMLRLNRPGQLSKAALITATNTAAARGINFSDEAKEAKLTANCSVSGLE